ncbi:MAG: YfhO family protein [bacterium]|nr:YfhO family protein [bacterium]MDD5756041.1 YfhO family protein [bacterium]
MKIRYRKILFNMAGWLFILFGILGLFLPVLQGLLFLLVGLFLLAKENPWAGQMFNRLKERYPRAYQHFERFKKKIAGYIRGTSVKQIFLSPAFLPLIGMCFFWSLVFFEGLFKNRIFMFGEIARFYLPGHKIMAEAWQHWHLPLWVSQLFCGFPLFAVGHLGVFYPLNFLAQAFLAPEYALSLLLIFHFLLAGFFTYIYTRYMGLEEIAALITSLVFAYGGFLVTNLMNVSLIFAATWLPLGFYCLERYIQDRRRSFLIWLSLVVALQVLAGNPQVVLCSIVVYAAYFAWFWSREKFPFREAVYFTALIILGLSLAGIQLLPYRELVMNGARSTNYGAVSFPIRNLITYIFPNFFGWQSPSASPYYYGLATYWDLACYIGIAPLVLALVSMMSRLTKHLNFFVFLFVAAMALSLSSHPSGISGYLLVVSFSLAVLAGFGLKIILLKKEHFSLALKRVYILIGSFMLLAFGLGYSLILIGKERLAKIAGIFIHIPFYKLAAWADQLIGGLQYSLNLVSLHVYAQLIILFLVYWTIKGFLGGEIKAKSFQLVLLGIIMCDLYYFGLGYNVTAEKNELAPSFRLLSILKRDPDYFRVYNYQSPDQGLAPNMNLLWKIDEVSGYSPMELKTARRQMKDIEQLDIRLALPLLGEKNVKYIIASQKITTAGLKVVFQDAQTYMYENLYFKQRAGYLQQKQYQPIIAFYHNGEIKIYTDLPRADQLVLKEMSYPGWQASIDGVPVLLEREEGMFNRIAVPAGKHEIWLHYRPRSLRLGMLLTACSMIVFLVLLFSKFSRRI